MNIHCKFLPRFPAKKIAGNVQQSKFLLETSNRFSNCWIFQHSVMCLSFLLKNQQSVFKLLDFPAIDLVCWKISNRVVNLEFVFVSYAEQPGIKSRVADDQHCDTKRPPQSRF
ncbi:uncharacterized protein LOC129755326 [Uranotaenia lowii]|uniref:uncharacterized protein LOC129755326 n=1 Tax=Uranotaenia lowii TaxID=190385 RepID=UPI0024798E9B|nr:uncharacterized protein LOC129755326 [Uranotaenia lowii]